MHESSAGGRGRGERELFWAFDESWYSVGAIPVSRANQEVGKEMSEWVVRDNEEEARLEMEERDQADTNAQLQQGQLEPTEVTLVSVARVADYSLDTQTEGAKSPKALDFAQILEVGYVQILEVVCIKRYPILLDLRGHESTIQT